MPFRVLIHSSKDIRFLGQTQHGIYDEADNIDTALLHRYYGAARSHTCDNPHNGSESSSDSGSNSDSSSSPDTTDLLSESSDSTSASTSESGECSGDSSDSSSTSESEESSKDGKDHSVDGDSDAEVGQESNGPESWQEIVKIITNAQQRNIHHDAAKVARSAMPFESMDEMHAYILALERALTSNE